MSPDSNEYLAESIAGNADLIKFEQMLMDAWNFAKEVKLPIVLCINVVDLQALQMKLQVISQSQEK